MPSAISHTKSLWAAVGLLLTQQFLPAQALPAATTVSWPLSDAPAIELENQPPAGNGSKPFWAIAHRVLVRKGVRDCLEDGANAIEMDVQAWRDQWYADHDGTLTSKGDSAESMFREIASQRKAGKNVGFVWLDIKNPDYCAASNPKCGIETLRRLARDILQPAGVRVLYGFYKSTGKAYPLIRDSLNENEALNLDGNSDPVRQAFETGGPKNLAQRVMSKGLFQIALNFGDCPDQDSGKICPQLRKAVESRAFGKVFGWTITKWNKKHAEELMDVGVDGLIYGFMATHYYDDSDVRKALSFLTNWVRNHPDKRYLATQDDAPW
ncbi:hypothetical protein CDD83_5404 [Cordyceps sp. RAO-2017]|nr:hypothetical protein CDD83_5404 [Cordyceps sp. RAO-2017]